MAGTQAEQAIVRPEAAVAASGVKLNQRGGEWITNRDLDLRDLFTCGGRESHVGSNA